MSPIKKSFNPPKGSWPTDWELLFQSLIPLLVLSPVPISFTPLHLHIEFSVRNACIYSAIDQITFYTPLKPKLDIYTVTLVSHKRDGVGSHELVSQRDLGLSITIPECDFYRWLRTDWIQKEKSCMNQQNRMANGIRCPIHGSCNQGPLFPS